MEETRKNLKDKDNILTSVKKIKKAKSKLQKINMKKQESPDKIEINKTEFNDFFVKVFYSILRDEESKMDAYTNGKLSIKEIHLIQTVGKLEKTEENTSSNIAKSLNITQGSLTVAVNVLIQKGYLLKTKCQTDKRIQRVTLTEIGKDIHFFHEKYHMNMINEITKLLTKKEQSLLLESLKKLSVFFKN